MRLAYDTNTIRCDYFIPFLLRTSSNYEIYIPAIVYAEKGYFYIINGSSIQTFNREIKAYHGQVMSLSPEQIQIAIQLAAKHRKLLPFRDHSRDYLIACQCQDQIDILLTYNKKHFQLFQLQPTQILEPEEFFTEFTPQ